MGWREGSVATGFIDDIGKPCRVFHVLLLVATVALKLSATGCKLPRHGELTAVPLYRLL